MQDKKGVTYILVGLIGLVIALLVLMIFTIFVWKPFVLESVDDYTCFISVVIKSKTKGGATSAIPGVNVVALGFKSPIDLRCKMHNKKIKDKEDPKKIIAKEMASCWGRLGEGKFDFYSDIDVTALFGTKNYCHPCAKITSKEDINVKGQDMISYLKDKRPKPIVDKRTYEQYIQGSGFKTGELLGGVGDFQIRDDNPLFVLFVLNKDEKLINRFTRGGISAGVAYLTLLRVSPGTAISKVGLVGSGIVGVANAVLQSKGFNANIVATDSKGVRELCNGYVG